MDPRVDWTISRRGIDYLGWGICAGSNWIREQANGGPYMTKKFMHLAANKSLQTNGSGFDNNRNFRAYRLAHILLMRAECYSGQRSRNGKNTDQPDSYARQRQSGCYGTLINLTDQQCSCRLYQACREL